MDKESKILLSVGLVISVLGGSYLIYRNVKKKAKIKQNSGTNNEMPGTNNEMPDSLRLGGKSRKGM